MSKELSEFTIFVITLDSNAKKFTSNTEKLPSVEFAFSWLNSPRWALAFSGSLFQASLLHAVANVVPAPFDYVGDQKRMVLLPEEVGRKRFPRISFPYITDRLVQKKACGRIVVRARLKAEDRNMLWM
ncbi:hypothetical protein TNCV_2959461 [Trichonephila clavipes]|nr:hypothetical protein TNCV_2959461 [Trichonephila clavipes]